MMARLQNRRFFLPVLAGVVLSAVFSTPRAAAMPFAAVGENIHVYLLGGLSVRYDDNLYLSRLNTQSDIVTTVTAGVQMEFGSPDTRNSANVMFRKNYVFYNSRSENNTDNMAFSGSATLAGAQSSVTVAASVTPSEYNSRDAIGLGRLVKSTNYTASIDGTYALTGKTRLSGGITYSTTEYSTDGYSNQSSITVPVRVMYEVTAKTDVRAGYTYRATMISGFEDQDSVDHTVSIGTSREITPTLSGDIEVGLTNRQLANGESGTIIPVNGVLTWVATPRMIYSAIARRDFGNSAIAGTSYLQTLVGLNMSYGFAERWNAAAGLSYEIADYVDSARVDNYWTGNIDVSYSPNQFMSMSAGYIFRMNTSTLQLAEFDSNVVSFSVNARY
ncbi:MAG: outer membrane beta-barrel protein [Opitutaceae bacterium]